MFKTIREYADEMDIWDIGLLKCCVFSLGILVALILPKRMRKPAALTALAVFVLSYAPLMYKFLKLVCKKNQQLKKA